ncbi:hypothetical protein OM076_41755 [Solirubrobacter ginsenosidimutans]|uniref:Uncharacterized protein n=1 Tax=Solirubrobacter ginsenosidimutans TaxID=490573 RepID=A0A9X3S8C6_9ACTN|nr:hypothetical protein [Solirubrobacter ginsenosidimutans]
MTDLQSAPHHVAGQPTAAERRRAFARAQRERVIASLLHCPDPAQPR